MFSSVIIISMHFSLFNSGDVRVNWSLVTKSGATLKAGDVVSVSGLGRLKVKGNHQLFPFRING